MQDVKDGNLRTILENMQKMNDYMAEKLRIYEEHLASLTGKERPILTESDKRRLAQKGKELNDFLLAAIEPTWAPGTIRKWYSDLVGAKYNSVNDGQKKRGRKPVSPEIVERVLQLAKSNPDWGYEHIAGTMRYLGYMNTLPEQCGIWDTMSVRQRFGIFWKRTASFLILSDDCAEIGLNLSKHSSM